MQKKGRAASGVEARPHSVKATGQLLEGSEPESVCVHRLALGNRWPLVGFNATAKGKSRSLNSNSHTRKGESEISYLKLLTSNVLPYLRFEI